jgi:hypothetical protein
MHYLGQDGQEELPIYFVLTVLVFLLWAWYYFNVSLKDILSLSAAKNNDRPVEKGKSEVSMTEKTQNLMNLKSLLDSGVLTQEEFDTQKKEILNS